MEGMDAGVMEPVETGSEVELEQEPVESGAETTETTTADATTEADPYSKEFSKEYSTALKNFRDSSPENAKYARVAKDDHARLYELHRMEPRGIDGVREKYAMLDSVMHGELKGLDAVTAMQTRVQEYADIDAKIAQGDASALESFNDEMKMGAVKMAPAILDMARTMDPEGYASAVLPHFVEALRSSELVQNFNGMVDVLNEPAPSWLTADQKQHWINDKMQRILGLAGGMGKWFNAQEAKIQGAKAPGNVSRGTGPQAPADKLSEERKAFEKEQQTHHWNTNINPKLDQHASAEFQKLFGPYDKRLKLDPTAKQGLLDEFAKRVSGKAAKNPVYASQIQRYLAQKNPDPAAVLNFAKVEFDKHSKGVIEALVNERYKPFLNGGKAAPAAPAGKTAAPVAPGVQIVTMKPPMDQIDHKNTPIEWIHQKKYRLFGGKVVQVRQ